VVNAHHQRGVFKAIPWVGAPKAPGPPAACGAQESPGQPGLPARLPANRRAEAHPDAGANVHPLNNAAHSPQNGFEPAKRALKGPESGKYSRLQSCFGGILQL
jgi:hypothetical protein